MGAALALGLRHSRSSDPLPPGRPHCCQCFANQESLSNLSLSDPLAAGQQLTLAAAALTPAVVLRLRSGWGHCWPWLGRSPPGWDAAQCCTASDPALRPAPLTLILLQLLRIVGPGRRLVGWYRAIAGPRTRPSQRLAQPGGLECLGHLPLAWHLCSLGAPELDLLHCSFARDVARHRRLPQPGAQSSPGRPHRQAGRSEYGAGHRPAGADCAGPGVLGDSAALRDKHDGHGRFTPGGRWSPCSIWWPAIFFRWRGWLRSSSSGGCTIPTLRRSARRFIMAKAPVPLPCWQTEFPEQVASPALAYARKPEKLERGYLLDRHPGFWQPIYPTHRPPHTRAECLLGRPTL